jgi:hypothetical protein
MGWCGIICADNGSILVDNVEYYALQIKEKDIIYIECVIQIHQSETTTTTKIQPLFERTDKTLTFYVHPLLLYM